MTERLKDGREVRRKEKRGILYIIDVHISLYVYISSNVVDIFNNF